jgi:hypothetical protein
VQKQDVLQQCAAEPASQPRHGHSSPARSQAPPTCQQQQQHQQQQDAEAVAQDLEARYLVRFRQYRMAEQHRATLDAALRSLKAANSSGLAAQPHQAWRWIERRNKAAAYPTDFGLLACRPAVAEQLKVGSSASLHCDDQRFASLPVSVMAPSCNQSVRDHSRHQLCDVRAQACLLREASVKDVHPDRRLSRSLAWASSYGAASHSLHHDASDDRIRKRPGRWAGPIGQQVNVRMHATQVISCGSCAQALWLM